jgi:hypothetical protein
MLILPGGTEDNHERPHAIDLVTRPGLEALPDDKPNLQPSSFEKKIMDLLNYE